VAELRFNPQTGQAVRLEGSEWVFAPVARNKSGETLAYDGADWVPIQKGSAPDQMAPSPMEGAYAQPQPEQPSMPWADVGINAVKNIPESGKQFASDIWQSIRHPIDTAGALWDVAEGGIGLLDPRKEHEDEPKARAVGKFFADRYGSGEGIKNTLATDPVGALADASALLTGGGSAVARAPALAGRIGKTVATVGKAIDPINIPVSAAKPVVKAAAAPIVALAGNFTGTGGDALRIAAETGAEGGEKGRTFREHMRGAPDVDVIVTEAKTALQNLRETRGKSYVESMEAVNEVNKALDFNPIDDAFSKIANRGKFKGQDIQPSTRNVVDKLAKLLDNWKMLEKAEYHTPMGMDALKKQVGDLLEGLDYGSAERGVVLEVYHAIKNEIVKQAPEYGKAMSDYERMSTEIQNVEKAVSLGGKKSVDQSLRALTSSLRNNVATNYGKRKQVVDKLSESGAPNLPSRIAGETLQSWSPRGLQGAGTAAAGIGVGAGVASGVLSPWVIPFMGATMPRVMGELTHGAGRVAGTATKLSPATKTLLSSGKRLTAFEAGRIQRELKEMGLIE
jgi:hypothetical protein